MERSKLVIIATVILFLSLMIGAGVVSIFFPLEEVEMQTVTVERLFLDIDGDGDIDLLVSGEVTFNSSSPLLPTPLP